jgi:uncharacterized protein
MSITASMLYNFVQCPHRVNMDLYGDPADKDKVTAFVQLLWEKGNAFERDVIQGLGVPFTDLGGLYDAEKEEATTEAMHRGDRLIYSGRIRAGNLLGEPDLLRKENGGYVAGDIKSGAGEEGSSDMEDRRPKKHYAVQLALYTDILEQLGLSAGRVPFVWDIHGAEIVYDLDLLQGRRNPVTLWSVYQEALAQVVSICSERDRTLPAYSSICKLCQWRTVCIRTLKKKKDLTLVPELGRSKRDAIMQHIKNIDKFAAMDIETLTNGNKTIIPGIGADTLRKFQTRAMLQVKKKPPFLKESLTFPSSEIEVFFDIETDPMQDICYLHGFVERRNGDNRTEKFVPFYADDPTPEDEKKAFAGAWAYIKSLQPCTIYYYSKYERTIWRKLREKYPDVMTEEEVEDLFDPEKSIDLYYDVVKKKTEWPTRDYSIKTLASFLGFSWRDTDPSGASSIEWYHRWIETRDESIKRRILTYNEDDCIATRVLLDGIMKLQE